MGIGVVLLSSILYIAPGGDGSDDGTQVCGTADSLVINGTQDFTFGCGASPSLTSSATLNIAATGDITLTPSGDDVVLNMTTDLTLNGDASPSIVSAGTLELITTGDLTITPSGDNIIFTDTEGAADIIFTMTESGSQGMAIQAQATFERDNNGFTAIGGVNGIALNDEVFFGKQSLSCADSGDANPSGCGGATNITDSWLEMTCLDAHGCGSTAVGWDLNAENPSHVGSLLLVSCIPTTGSCVFADGAVFKTTGTINLDAASDRVMFMWDGAAYVELFAISND